MDQEQWEKKLMQLAKTDAWYQQLLQECEDAEADYLQLRSMLPPEDQEKLDHYITLCEELGHRLTCLARNISGHEKKMDG